MRTRQAFINALSSLTLQLALAISGLLVPRFFIAAFGSSVNGLVSSISQFISYLSLVEAGVGAASTVALYKPLVNGDTDSINGILSATKKFYLRSGLIFAGLVAALVIFYPYIVDNEIKDIAFIRVMVLVLSVNGLVDYFFLGKYRVLLMADQRGYVLYLIQILGTVVMTAVSILQIKLGSSALSVKSTAAVIYILRSLAAIIYCKLKYPNYRFNAPPATDAVSQRNSALVHQIVGTISSNIAVILITVMYKDGLSEVSVYSVYTLVSYALSGLLTSLTNSLTPSFGQVISVGEYDTLKKSYSSFEMIMFIMIFVFYSCMAVLLYPFVHLYSTGFTDGVVYTRWSLVFLFSLSGILQAIRTPGLTLISGAGHYKETCGRAILEMVINIGISVALTPKLGLVGVMIGLSCSYLYRTTDIILYSSKHFLNGMLKTTLFRLVRNLAVIAVIIYCGITFLPQVTDSWLTFLCSGVAVGSASLISLLAVNYLFEAEQIKSIFKMILGIFKRSA